MLIDSKFLMKTTLNRVPILSVELVLGLNWIDKQELLINIIISPYLSIYF